MTDPGAAATPAVVAVRRPVNRFLDRKGHEHLSAKQAIDADLRSRMQEICNRMENRDAVPAGTLDALLDDVQVLIQERRAASRG